MTARAAMTAESAVGPGLGAPAATRMIDGEAHETAAAHVVTRVPVASPEDSVETVIEALPGSGYESANAVYVLDARGRPVGIVSLPALLAGRHDRLMHELMTSDFPTVHPEDDQEEVALAALRCGIAAVPVVDRDDRLLGVVPPLALLQILHREHVEDLHRIAGIQREQGWARRALEEPPHRRLRHRLPWLLAGLIGTAIAAFVMAQYRSTLEGRVAIAFFIPGIIYLAGAIGMQTQTITVRGLSLGSLRLRDLARRELSTGFQIGLLLAAIAFPAIALTMRDVPLAAAVSTALACAGILAGALGLAMPWTLDRLGIDPAFGSGPVATILQDVASLLIYFVMVRLFLG